MLVQPITNQFITNKIQYSRRMQSGEKELSAEQKQTALPYFVDAKNLVNISFKARIHDCAEDGDWEGVKEELAKGVDVNSRNEKGWTALKKAARYGKYFIVENLLQYRGIDVNAQDDEGWTALMNAAGCGHTDIANLLINHPNIDVNVQNKDGATALILAASYRHVKITEELLKVPDIDVNVRTKHGNTALILACMENDIKTVTELLKHPDIDVNVYNENGRAAIDYANETIKEMIQNYVWEVDKREEVLPPKIDIKKLTSFDKIWSDEERQNLEKLIKEKNYRDVAAILESKGVELNEKYKLLITEIDKLKEQTRISETEKIRRKEEAKARKAFEEEIEAERILLNNEKQALENEKAKYEEQNRALNNLIQTYKTTLAEDVAYERETLESGFRTLYGIKPQDIPENATFGEQMVYVTDVLLNRRNKLTGTNGDTPEKITKALQDNNGRISQDGLRFLERVIDTNDGQCQEKDIIDAIESVKDNHGLLDMGAVSFFISSLAWAGNSIRSVIEKVGKYGVKTQKIIR